MNELERYIREQHSQDRQELKELQVLAAESLPVVIKSWSKDRKEWPYVAFEGPPRKYSFSTNAMILFSLSVILDRTKSSSLMPAQPDNSHFPDTMFNLLERDHGEDYGTKVELQLAQGVQKLLQKVNNRITKPVARGLAPLLTTSTTYGENDVLTLTWLTELLRAAWAHDRSGSRQSIRLILPSLKKAVDQLRKTTLEDFSSASHSSELRCFYYRERINGLKLGAKAPDKKPLEHPFPLVRLVQLLEANAQLSAEMNGTRTEQQLTEVELGGKALLEYFERGLHEHIAYYSIPDSRFDPAFLVFCLEGALRFNSSTVSGEAIDRALRVLEECEDICWHMNAAENLRMWQEYAKAPPAVAIVTTYRKLRQALPAYIEMGVVRYIDYTVDRFPTLNMFEYIMHKNAASFAFEQEVRAIAFPPVEADGAAYQHFNENLFAREDRPASRVLAPPVNISALTDCVVLHPESTVRQEQQAKALCIANGIPCPIRSTATNAH